MYVCPSCSTFSLGLLKPTGHSNAKAFVKPMMHCQPIDVIPESPAEETALRFLAKKRAPADISRSETRGSICVHLRTCTCLTWDFALLGGTNFWSKIISRKRWWLNIRPTIRCVQYETIETLTTAIVLAWSRRFYPLAVSMDSIITKWRNKNG